MSPSLLSVFLTGAIVDFDGTILIQLAIFFIAFLLLRSFVFKPMIALFDAREAAIDGAKKEARELESGADDKLKAFESEMKKVKIEATAERDAIHKDALRLERELLAKAREEADAMLDEATKKMQGEAAAIRGEMKTSVPALAGQIADKLLGRRAA